MAINFSKMMYCLPLLMAYYASGTRLNTWHDSWLSNNIDLNCTVPFICRFFSLIVYHTAWCWLDIWMQNHGYGDPALSYIQPFDCSGTGTPNLHIVHRATILWFSWYNKVDISIHILSGETDSLKSQFRIDRKWRSQKMVAGLPLIRRPPSKTWIWWVW